MKSILKNYTLSSIILVIGLLLLANIYLIDRNNSIILENKKLQEDAEKLKLNTTDIIRNIHFLDMTLRGYALIVDKEYPEDFKKSVRIRDQNFGFLESALAQQHFPMQDFYLMRDSIKVYFDIVAGMKSNLDHNRRDLFIAELAENKGYKAWLVYSKFANKINDFENSVVAKAQTRYDETLRNSYLLQVLMFFIIVPTLGYTVHYTSRAMKVTEQLRQSEAQRNITLEDQKQILEQRVLERTNEVTEQNQKLQQAAKTIEEQSGFIQLKNEELSREVARQTQHLQQTNLELVEHNNRLEQFTYIISHNLRAPITRLVGLSNILNYEKQEQERDKIVKLIVKSTNELDEVIVDLNQILGIQKLNTKVFKEISLPELIEKVRLILDAELLETKGELVTDFKQADKITSLPQYMESIFYNLISNAIKYRHPDRLPVIQIQSAMVGPRLQIEIADNGLGIDVEKNKHNLFNLYKRFHFHVEGKGLGLYLVKTQVTALGGSIDIRSKPDEGTVFTILFDN